MTIEFSTPQGINESAKFCFLQNLSVIFGFRRYCPRSLSLNIFYFEKILCTTYILMISIH